MSGKRKGIKKNKADFSVDTFQKAKELYHALQLPGTADRLRYAFNCFPELMELTHEKLSEIFGADRESITRAMVKLGLRRRKRDEVKLD